MLVLDHRDQRELWDLKDHLGHKASLEPRGLSDLKENMEVLVPEE